MLELTILDALKEYIYECTAHIKLPKPYDPGTAPAFVRPNVYVGWMPPKNYNPQDYDIPAIVIGAPSGSEDEDSGVLDIQLSFILFNPGEDPNTQNTSPSPDMEGYRDLIFLMNYVKYQLFKSVVIKNKTSLQKPITWGIHEEQPYPYWTGWLKFQAVTPQVEPEIFNEGELFNIKPITIQLN